jgi:hypothetical protein
MPASRQPHRVTQLPNVFGLASSSAEVTVVVPCYNVEPYVKRALDSALAQAYRDFHIYAVDDGSTDGTLAALQTYSEHCCIVSQQHMGAAAARNRAIQMSSSPFIAFLDADDEWLPHKLECQLSLLKQNPDLGLVCSLCAAHEPGKQMHSIFLAHLPGSGMLFQQLVRDCFVFTPTVVVRRQCLEDVGIFNESLKVSEDFNLWLRIASRWKIALLPDVLAVTHERPGSLSATISPEERLSIGVAALEDVRSRCSDVLSTAEAQALRVALAQRFYFLGSFLLSDGAAARSRSKFVSALKFQPTHWRAVTKLGLSFLPFHTHELLAHLRKTPATIPSRASTPLVSRDTSSL